MAAPEARVTGLPVMAVATSPEPGHRKAPPPAVEQGAPEIAGEPHLHVDNGVVAEGAGGRTPRRRGRPPRRLLHQAVRAGAVEPRPKQVGSAAQVEGGARTAIARLAERPVLPPRAGRRRHRLPRGAGVPPEGLTVAILRAAAPLGARTPVVAPGQREGRPAGVMTAAALPAGALKAVALSHQAPGRAATAPTKATEGVRRADRPGGAPRPPGGLAKPPPRPPRRCVRAASPNIGPVTPAPRAPLTGVPRSAVRGDPTRRT